MSTEQIIKFSPYVGAMVGGIVMLLLVYRIKPARRGKIRTERDHFFEGRKAEEIKAEMVRRLEEEKFTILQTTDADLIKAQRKKPRPKNSVMKNYPFHKLKLDVEVRLNRREDGVVAKMSVGVLDSLIADSGEGEYLEVMLDYLMIAQSLRPMAPVVNMSSTLMPMFCSIMLLFFPVMLLLPSIKGKEEAGFFLNGLAFAAIVFVIWSLWGIIQVAASGGKYKGMKYSGISIALSIFSFIIGVTLYIVVAS